MLQLCYGVWDNIPFDNRGMQSPKSPENCSIDIFQQFDNNNPIDIFLCHRGFLVFSEKASLFDALLKHQKHIAKESCGKCTPCRNGSRLIEESMENISQNKNFDWSGIESLAILMKKTALCGIGKTGVVPLLNALKFFPQELEKTKMPSGGFYATTTSPCIEACPSHVNIPRYIDYIKDGHNELASALIMEHYPLVGSCGRVCVKPCEKACNRAKIDEAVNIRDLKRFAADHSVSNGTLYSLPKENITQKPKTAVIGAGPAGITCAFKLLESGFPVDIFESKSFSGGMIRYGIPSYRLPKDILAQESRLIEKMGGNFLYNQKLGKNFSIDDLFSRGYHSVFIATGCPKGSYLGMEGEDTSLENYVDGVDFLEHIHESLSKGEKPILSGDVVVVGGGNVAMDCCRSAIRITSGTVHLVYRRTEADAPADPEEIAEAKKEGVQFHFLTGQDRLIVEKGQITGLQCIEMEQTTTDASGRRAVRPAGKEPFIIPAQNVIAAIGQQTDSNMLSESDGITCDKKSYIIVDEFQATSRAGVFAGGDGTSGSRSSGPSTLINAMTQGSLAAQSIISYTEGKTPFTPREKMSKIIKNAQLLSVDPVCERESQARVRLESLPIEQRRSFTEVEHGMKNENAWYESERCMRCYRIFSVFTENSIPNSNN